MKAVLCLLVFLPLALSAPLTAEEEELYRRFIADTFHHLHLPSAHELGQKILSGLGSDTSEAACKLGCPAALNALVPGSGIVGGFLCNPACEWVKGQLNG